jgi:hypothetical protein
MKNELQRLFLIFLAAIAVFVVLYAFWGPQGKKINLKEIEFSTTNSSELYFKNIRSYFYDKEENADAKFVLYRINSREKDSSKLKLNFLLVNNWSMNECYLIAESNKENPSLKWKLEEEVGSIELEGENNRAHFIFGAELFEQLDRSADLWWIDSGAEKVLTEEEKSSLKTSLKDYFKLVGKLR